MPQLLHKVYSYTNITTVNSQILIYTGISLLKVQCSDCYLIMHHKTSLETIFFTEYQMAPLCRMCVLVIFLSFQNLYHLSVIALR